MEPIDKIVAILAHRGRSDLARMLNGSSYLLNGSSTYGSRLFSTLTTVEIYSSIEQHEKLRQLADAEREAILEAFKAIYPVRDHSLEISWLEFFVDPNMPLPIPMADLMELKKVDFAYIHEQIQKCDERLNIADYEGAITNARNLLETICKYILDNMSVEYKDRDDLGNLYKKVSSNLNMDPSKYEESYFKEILSGCFSIVNGLANVRNALGDAHGKSQKTHYRPSQRHALFTVGIAKAISEYLYSSYLENQKGGG